MQGNAPSGQRVARLSASGHHRRRPAVLLELHLLSQQGAQAWLAVCTVLAVRHFRSCQFYELLDTYLRVAKGQPLTFLHVFHHAVVLVMAYAVRGPEAAETARLTFRRQWLDSVQSLQVMGLLTNTAVHVAM